MKYKILFYALIKFRNILFLGLWFFSIYSFQSLLPSSFLHSRLLDILPMETASYLAGIVLYFVLVYQSLSSKKFNEDFNKKKTINTIGALEHTLNKLVSDLKKLSIGRYDLKLRKLIEDKNDILDSFFRGERTFVKEKIVENALNLLISYAKLISTHSIITKELGEINIREIVARINSNTQKLTSLKDPFAINGIKDIIEMDNRIISRLKEEKRNLDKISTQLDYIESMVGIFKYRISSSIDSEEIIEDIRAVVNEANALENVLEARNRNKLNW